MDVHLLGLLRTNDTPSDAVIRGVKERIRLESQELQQSEIEIERLNSQIELLKEKHAGIRASIDQQNIIIAPIRRVPPDVLSEIFYHCIPTHRNPIMKAAEAPVLLTRICSSWRRVAFSSPRLWAQLHIPLPGEYHMFTIGRTDETGAHSDAEEFDQTLSLRCEVVQQWLARSGTCPLSLSLFYPCSPFAHTLPLDKASIARLDVFTRSICNIITPLAHRWQDLELSVPLDIYYQIQDLISISTLRLLRTIRLNVPDRGKARTPTEQPLKFMEAPNLRHMSLSASKNSWHFKPISTSIHWENLTYLCILSSFPDLHVLTLFKLCYNLVDCSLSVLARWDSINRPEEDQAVTGMAHLPKLHSLSIIDAGSASIMAKTFKSIYAPSLTCIRYLPQHWQRAGSNFNLPPTPHMQPILGAPSPIVGLLENPIPLKKIYLDSHALKAPDVFQLLLRVDSVTHLVLGREPPRITRGDGQNLMLPSYHMDRDSFNPSLLGVAPSPAEGITLLLPNLEVLVLYQLTTYSDERLQQLVIERIAGWKRGQVAPLKLVRAFFNRERQVDIIGAVMQYADDAGLSIKLDITYTPSRPKYLQPFSTSFGLTIDDRSWSSTSETPLTGLWH